MEFNYHYGTITEAIQAFRTNGFTLDFNLGENCIICDNSKFEAEDFEITALYRYEGNTDPADEAVVYAIQSNQGHKGILVTGYGISSDSVSARILEKLTIRNE